MMKLCRAAPLVVFFLMLISLVWASDEPSSFNITAAGEKGIFNIGPALGDVITAAEESAKKEVLKLDYSIFKGSIIGVWTKIFPAELEARGADAVRVGIKAADPAQLSQISVKLEIKGMKGVQTIPLRLGPGWSYTREAVSWDGIGELHEVVFVVNPTDAGKKLDGIVYLDLDFYRLTPLQKYLIFIKTGLVFAVSFLLALLAALFGKLSGRGPSGGRRINRDLLYGVTTVLTIGTGFHIYALGKTSPLDAGLAFNFLFVGIMGGVIAGLLKRGITGTHLTALETFQNIFFSGLLAASSSTQGVLQGPAAWVQVLMFSNTVAAIAFFIYHISNARSLVSTGRHLKFVSGALIAGTPYLFNLLLLVESESLVQALGDLVTFHLIAAWPLVTQILGRVLVVFCFNEAVTNGVSLITKDKAISSPKAHLSVFLVSWAVVIAPLVADLGSCAAVAHSPLLLEAIVVVLTTMVSFAGLWAEVYLITGALLDAGKHTAPSSETISRHVNVGMKKGMAYSAIVMALLYALKMLLGAGASQAAMNNFPVLVGILAGALTFPLIKTIIESFDGSLPFFERTRYGYRDMTLYARGAVAGFAFAYMATHRIFQWPMRERILFGCAMGLLASGGVSFARDIVYAVKHQGRIQSWRLYFVDSIIGAFIGSAAAFYMDALQVPVIIEKFKLYTSVNFSPVEYVTYPLVNKWGRINMGSYAGGAKLVFLESLAGVINWSIAAWLFAINKVFMQAFFEKDTTPIKFFFSRAGFAQLVEHMIYVLRWGLWMSPIIFTGLRMMPDPTWYNQDGAIRTIFAAYHNMTMSPDAFRAWSLQVFVYILACDVFRVLIWMDHMGLRVATLVNLSFIGMDRLDERLARFIGSASAQRYIPEGVKRFATWAPLLIPFYLPRGQEWDSVWNTSQAMQNASAGKDAFAAMSSLGMFQAILVGLGGMVLCTGISFCFRVAGRRSRARRITSYELANREYKVTAKENGEVYSEVIQKEHDVTRRSYDIIDPCGRVLYLADVSGLPDGKICAWPVAGNFPRDKFKPSYIERGEDSLKIVNTSHDIKTTVEIKLPDQDSAAEIWDVTIENMVDKPRQVKVIPYLEWVLNGGIHDRFHTQYARLYPEMEYVSGSNAVLSWQKSTKAMGILAGAVPPEGFLTSRVDFIGRARSIWSPRILESFTFLPASDTAPYPTFDPIGSLVLNAAVGSRAVSKVRFMIGYAKNRKAALELIETCLKPKKAGSAPIQAKKKDRPLIGHGEIPPGTPQPYSQFIDNGRKLRVLTPFTPRPIDHTVSNAIHSIMVTNRGLHTSCNGNSQQNRLTPDWADTVTKEVPTEAIYLYDPDAQEWFSPTYHPLNSAAAKYESEFGVDGTAVFRMTQGTLATELSVFVPPGDPTGVYLLTIKNLETHARKIRVAPYFQMVLSLQPERSGPLLTRHDKELHALFFENPRNIFRSGSAFASMSIPDECAQTKRGRFFGSGRSPARPFMVEKGSPDATQRTDERQVAAFLGSVEVPARGEYMVAIILGQADTRKDAARIIKKYKDIEAVQQSLADTRKWWLGVMGTVTVETNQPEFDAYQNWLKYQALAERIWARRGFYQTSGAYGFRDQLQDTVNLMWVDPALARRQIILHASQQFIEGDVFHWFFTLTDGRTAFSCRSHASDNPLWIAWAVGEYVRVADDYSILDEMTSYVVSEFPFAPLPKNKQGWGHLYHRTTRSDTVYRHCMRSIDLILKKRTGKNGLPLMGTGDWNDGLDEIGSEGKGESVWLGFFLYYILKEMLGIIERKDGARAKEYYQKRMDTLKEALEKTWRDDRYLRAIHDDGTEIGLKDSGIWEIDALTAAWAVMSGINIDRGIAVFNTALRVLEKDDTILLGWPALREDTKPYLGRSSKYPEGVRENGMYCHGVQWLVKAARILAEEFERRNDRVKADEYRATAYRLWLKISPIPHVVPQKIEIYGGQPNKQAADFLTMFDRGRMIWHGYTGAAGWMLRQAFEGVVGASLVKNELILPDDLDKARGALKVKSVQRDVTMSPLTLTRGR